MLPDDDPRERQRWLSCQVRGCERNAAVVGLFVTQVLRLRTDLDVIDFEAYGFVEERPFMAA